MFIVYQHRMPLAYGENLRQSQRHMQLQAASCISQLRSTQHTTPLNATHHQTQEHEMHPRNHDEPHRTTRDTAYFACDTAVQRHSIPAADVNQRNYNFTKSSRGLQSILPEFDLVSSRSQRRQSKKENKFTKALSQLHRTGHQSPGLHPQHPTQPTKNKIKLCSGSWFGLRSDQSEDEQSSKYSSQELLSLGGTAQ